jgi:ATPase family protein associated with various cellular activities (AAA)/winged helix domain-containing protein
VSDNGNASWERMNNDFLAASLMTLRAKLLALASARGGSEVDRPLEPAPRRPSLADRLFHRGSPKLALPPGDSAPTESTTGIATTSEHDHSDGVPAIVDLANRLGLSQFEREVVLLAVASELDPQLDGLCARAQGDAGRPFPSFALALRLFDDPAWSALAPDGPLRRLQLIQLGPGGAVTAEFRSDERIVNYVKGLNHLDERLRVLLAPVGTGDGLATLTPSQLAVADGIAQRAIHTPSPSLVVDLVGADSASKRLVAQHVAAAVGRFLLRLPAPNLPSPGPELDLFIRLWEREALLSPIALLVDASDDAGDPGHDGSAAVGRLLSVAPGLVLLDSREVWPRLPPETIVADVSAPLPAEQRSVWAAALGPGSEQLAGDLASQFSLDPVTIDSLARNDDPDADAAERRSRVWRAVLGSTRPRLDLLAERIEPKATRNDLVLPADVVTQLDHIEAQVRHRSTVHADWGLAERTSRGLGISALFAGESGTGKTLAAEVIAGELELNLYRIDLSAVVSKYIGETEKNLRRLFDAAERGGTILFFDEADALFGKRTEVKDSHDRYANIEVNYLLQRMEAYQGLAVLATNMKASLDHAFTRRLRFVIDFPFPSAEERKRIWRRAFVPHVDTSRLDFDQLSQLTLTGGSIHNVAVNATFQAAAADHASVTPQAVLDAARLEYKKLGLPINDADFRAVESPELGLVGSAQ